MCFLAFILFQVLTASNKISEETYTYASSFFVVLVIVATIAGFVYRMKGLKEPISVKKTIGLLVNAFLIVLFTSLLLLML